LLALQGKTETTAEMQVVEVLLETGWSYETYRQQPKWIIEHILSKKVAQVRFNKFRKKYGG